MHKYVPYRQFTCQTAALQITNVVLFEYLPENNTQFQFYSGHFAYLQINLLTSPLGCAPHLGNHEWRRDQPLRLVFLPLQDAILCIQIYTRIKSINFSITYLISEFRHIIHFSFDYYPEIIWSIVLLNHFQSVCFWCRHLIMNRTGTSNLEFSHAMRQKQPTNFQKSLIKNDSCQTAELSRKQKRIYSA